MKGVKLIWILVALLIASVGINIWLSQRRPSSSSGVSEMTSAEPSKQLYTCGMHPNVIQEGPGNCPICGMKLVPLKGSAPAAAAQTGERKILYWWDPMDPNYISDKPGKSPMGMDLVPVYEDQMKGSIITIDPATVLNIGVRTGTVQRRDLSRTIVTNGVVAPDEARTFRINPKVSGWIEKLYVDQTGKPVREGQPLLDIYSPELVAAEEEYLLALKGYRALESASTSPAQSGAKDLLSAARGRLKYWDITDGQISALEVSGKVSRLMTLYSPATGIVIRKDAVEGGYVNAGMDLFQIADLSEVWINAQVYEYELPWVEVDQHAMVKVASEPGKVLHGKVHYIYPYLDPMTRTAAVRLVFPNRDNDLKLDMYAEVQIDTRDRPNVLAIPEEAVVRSGRRNVAFLALGEGKFLPREITLGLEADSSLTEVLSGLNEGDRVATSAQFLLDSEAQLQEALQKMLAAAPDSSVYQATDQGRHGDSTMSMPMGKMEEHSMQTQSDHRASGATMDKLYTADSLYWCPMHHEIVSTDGDAHCPICNMHLVSIPADSLASLRSSHPYGCPMDPVVVSESEKDRKCPLCGMALEVIQSRS